MLPIFVVNNFGQFNHLIQRMLRDLEIEVQMVANTLPPEEVAAGCRGIILGGGPTLDRIGNGPRYLDLGLPVLGICLGLHTIAVSRGGSVHPGTSGGYGHVDVEILEHEEILAGYPAGSRYGPPTRTRWKLSPPGSSGSQGPQSARTRPLQT